MTRWEEFELKRLAKRVEKAITKYGKTTVLKELSQVVRFDHLHTDYHHADEHADDHDHDHLDGEPIAEHCAECDDFHNSQHQNVVVERKTEDVLITCVDEKNSEREKDHGK